MSEQIDQLATALSKAQGEMPVAFKNCRNPFFKSMYADFESITEAITPSFSNYGLSYTQEIDEEDNGNSYLITFILHASGQWLKSRARIKPAKDDVQAFSSYTSYLKRICLSASSGVATGEAEDDGNYNVEPPQKYQQQPPKEVVFKVENIKPVEQPVIQPVVKQPIPVIKKISADQLKQLDYELDRFPQIKEKVISALSVDHLRDMPEYVFLSSLNRIRELIQLEKEIKAKKEING